MKISSHYGGVELEFDDLLAEEALDRLKRVTLANIPKSLCEESSDVNRFDHSVGVYHLACLVQADEEDSRLLKVSSLLHDIGIPCFGHIGERIMMKIYGFDHEKRGSNMVMDEDIGDSISKEGVKPCDVRNIFLKKHYLSPLLFGSMDLDNLDNMNLYWSSIGKPVHYNPERMASLFSVGDERVLFSGNASDIGGWRRTRHDLYMSLNTVERRTKEVMLMHALEMCAEEIPDVLFMDNRQAMAEMMGNSGSSKILEDLKNNILYESVVFKPVPFCDMEELEKKMAEKYPDCILKIDHLKLDRDISFWDTHGELKEFPRTHGDKMHVGVYKPF
jgi:HD superfamily phosphohydrolase